MCTCMHAHTQAQINTGIFTHNEKKKVWVDPDL